MIKKSFNILRPISYHIKKLFLSPLPIRIYLLQNLMRKFKLATFEQRLKYDALLYPAYAYGMYCAALQAKSLGLKKISAIEFIDPAGTPFLVQTSIIVSLGRLRVHFSTSLRTCTLLSSRVAWSPNFSNKSSRSMAIVRRSNILSVVQAIAKNFPSPDGK